MQEGMNSNMLDVTRNEIASCEETAYESLPLKDAATLLFFTSQSELLTFAQQVQQTSAHYYLQRLTNAVFVSSAVGR
jgi:hypothetical protein